MWHPHNIVIKNLFSHSYSELNFITGQMVLILGEVTDEAGSDSNGAGKSAIIEGITLAVTGDVWRGIGKENFIKYNERSCVVIMKLNNDLLKETMIIERTIFNSTASSKLRIYINDEEITDLPTLNDGNKFILDRLGISKEDFLNYYVIGQSNNKSFFSAGDAKQKEIISRFSNFHNIDKICDQIDDKINKLNSGSIPSLELSVRQLDGHIDTLEIRIKDKIENFEIAKQEQLIRIKETIAICDRNKSNLQVKIDDDKISIQNRSSKIDALKLKIDGVEEILQELKKVEKRCKFIRVELLDVRQMQSTLKVQSGMIIQCPKCNNEFIPESDLTVKEVKESLPVVEENIRLYESEEKDWDVHMDEIKVQLQQIKENQSRINVLQNEINSYQNLSEEYQKQIGEIKDQKNYLLLDIAKNSKSSVDKDLIDLKSKLRIQIEERIGQRKQLNELQKELEDLKFYQFHFSRQGFKTYLANKSIKTIQDICNYYLKRFQTNLQVDISGFKILKSGEVRDKIEISILKNGIKKGVFNQYSGGQKSRVDICGIIAINRLINNTVEPEKGLDLLAIDEIGDLDASGKFEIVKILEKSDITNLLVMHEVGDLPCKNKIYVVYKSGHCIITEKR